MEIAVLPKSSLRIKGKQAVIIVNPSGKHEENASIVTRAGVQSKFSPKDGVVIASPGEYEVAGLKIRGSQVEGFVVYSMSVDSVEVLFGTLSAFEKSHSRLQEHDVVLVDVDKVVDPSFLTSLSAHAILFTGEMAKEVVDSFVKESTTQLPKFVSTKEKLSQEVETILLSV